LAPALRQQAFLGAPREGELAGRSRHLEQKVHRCDLRIRKELGEKFETSRAKARERKCANGNACNLSAMLAGGIG